MKKLGLSLYIILVALLLVLVFAACDNDRDTQEKESNLIYLLVTQCEKAESDGWTFEQFVKHADSDRGVSAVFRFEESNQYRQVAPQIYKRILNIDNNTVLHHKISRQLVRTNIANDGYVAGSFFEGLFFPRNLSDRSFATIITVTIIDEFGQVKPDLSLQLQFVRIPVMEPINLSHWGGELRVSQGPIYRLADAFHIYVNGEYYQTISTYWLDGLNLIEFARTHGKGLYVFTARASADGFDDSDFSNTVIFEVTQFNKPSAAVDYQNVAWDNNWEIRPFWMYLYADGEEFERTYFAWGRRSIDWRNFIQTGTQITVRTSELLYSGITKNADVTFFFASKHSVPASFVRPRLPAPDNLRFQRFNNDINLHWDIDTMGLRSQGSEHGTLMPILSIQLFANDVHIRTVGPFGFGAVGRQTRIDNLNLEPGDVIQLRAIRGNFLYDNSELSDIIIVGTQSVLANPTGFRIDDNYIISWDAVYGATHYEIFFDNRSMGFPFVNSFRITVYEASIYLNKIMYRFMDEFYIYHIVVRAISTDAFAAPSQAWPILISSFMD